MVISQFAPLEFPGGRYDFLNLRKHPTWSLRLSQLAQISLDMRNCTRAKHAIKCPQDVLPADSVSESLLNLSFIDHYFMNKITKRPSNPRRNEVNDDDSWLAARHDSC
jgi:hypothetical protein